MLKNDVGQSGPPDCFGKWFDRTASECVGGHDTTYTDASGRHIRPPCDYQGECATRAQATKLIPAAALNRPPQQYATSNPYARPPWQSPPYQPPAPPTPQSQYHQQMMPVNFAIPQYLTVREPVHRPRGRRLLVEVLRSMGKAFGHTISNFFDFEAFTDNQPVQPQPPPDQTERK